MLRCNTTLSNPLLRRYLYSSSWAEPPQPCLVRRLMQALPDAEASTCFAVTRPPTPNIWVRGLRKKSPSEIHLTPQLAPLPPMSNVGVPRKDQVSNMSGLFFRSARNTLEATNIVHRGERGHGSSIMFSAWRTFFSQTPG